MELLDRDDDPQWRDVIVERRPSKCSTRHCRFADSIAAGGATGAPLIVLPQSKKAGSSDIPEPLSSNDVAATMALIAPLNRIAISKDRGLNLTRGPPP